MRSLVLFAMLWALVPSAALAQGKTVRVFVALADNASQGVAPMPAKIGNGDLPAQNLYWGCTEGLKQTFKHSQHWKLSKQQNDVSNHILERLEFTHAGGEITLVAEAYRGRQIRACLADFEKCVANGQDDLAVYIGHNGLMDFDLPPCDVPSTNTTQAIVLCCKSRLYFAPRLEQLHARPLVLTEQFMYPGAFILEAVLEEWAKDGSLAQFRHAAAQAYSRNQDISLKAALGVFTKIADPDDLTPSPSGQPSP